MHIPHLPMLLPPRETHYCNLISCIVHENVSIGALLEINTILLFFQSEKHRRLPFVICRFYYTLDT